MSSISTSNIKVVENQDALSETQRIQFRQVMVEGLKGKLQSTLFEDTDSMLKLVETWIRYKFMPMDETFCAVDSTTGNVLSIVLLNNFKTQSLIDIINVFINWVGTTGLKKALKQSFSFLKLDRYNKKMNDPNVVAEIYWVSTREDLRGKGIGTLLLNHVLEYLHSKCRCAVKDNCTCKIKLLVFARNPAKKLYERLGFKQAKCITTPDMEKAFGEEYDALVWMEKAVFG